MSEDGTMAILTELRRIADGYLGRRGPGHTLSPTALVDDAYFAFVTRNVPVGSSEDESRYILAQLLWRVMIDHFRSKRRQKNGGHLKRTTLVTDVGEAPRALVDPLELDLGFESVEKRFGVRRRKVAEMKLLAGMTSKQIGLVLGISASTVRDDWKLVRAYLCVFLGPGDSVDDERPN